MDFIVKRKVFQITFKYIYKQSYIFFSVCVTNTNKIYRQTKLHT